MHDTVADARTIRLFREQRTQAKAMDRLLTRFDDHLRDRSFPALPCRIIDALIVAAPARRNTDALKAALKRGEIPADGKAKPAKPARKDRDPRWTLKRSRSRNDRDGRKIPEIMVPAFG